ncbi:hypothetical protein Tco_0611014 [Tanacetum coccineum]
MNLTNEKSGVVMQESNTDGTTSFMDDQKDEKNSVGHKKKLQANEYKDKGRFCGSKSGGNESDAKPSFSDISKAKACMLAKAQSSDASSKAKVQAYFWSEDTPQLWLVQKRGKERGRLAGEADFTFLCILVLISDSSDDRKGSSKASVPIFEGPSVQGLLDHYGYNDIEEYLSWNYFPSTDKDITDEDCIHESNYEEYYKAYYKAKKIQIACSLIEQSYQHFFLTEVDGSDANHFSSDTENPTDYTGLKIKDMFNADSKMINEDSECNELETPKNHSATKELNAKVIEENISTVIVEMLFVSANELETGVEFAAHEEAQESLISETVVKREPNLNFGKVNQEAVQIISDADKMTHESVVDVKQVLGDSPAAITRVTQVTMTIVDQLTHFAIINNHDY